MHAQYIREVGGRT